MEASPHVFFYALLWLLSLKARDRPISGYCGLEFPARFRSQYSPLAWLGPAHLPTLFSRNFLTLALDRIGIAQAQVQNLLHFAFAMLIEFMKITSLFLKSMYILIWLNAFLFWIEQGFIGGLAADGKVDGDRYFLGFHGTFREVTSSIYNFSIWHGRTVFATFPLAVIVTVVLEWKHRNAD